MASGTTLSRATGFLRLAAMTYALGVAQTRLADAYNVANTTPNIIYELVLGGVLTSVLVPVIVEWAQQRGREEASEMAGSMLGTAVVLLTAVTAVVILAAPLVVRLYTMQARGPAADAQRALATFFLRWFAPQILFYGLGAVVGGLLNAHRRFAATAFAPVFNNLVVIATFLMFAALPGPDRPTPDGITATQRLVLAVGTTLGVVAMTVALWPPLRRLGLRIRPRLDARHEAIRRIGRLALWTTVYVLANQVGLLVVIVLATGVTGYTAYTSAFILFQLPYAIFSVSIMTALLPELSARWASGERDAFRALLARGVRSSGFIVIPAALGYMVLARPIVGLVLEHGVTTAADAELVAGILVFFSIGLFSFSTFLLFLQAFYAMQDTATPALVNVAAVALNTVVNVVFFELWGVRGLALGHATAYTFAAVTCAVILRRRLGGLEGRTVMRHLGKVVAAAGVMAAVAYAASRALGGVAPPGELAGQTIAALGPVAVGLFSYAGLTLMLRIEGLSALRASVRRRIRS